eukprot:PLAT3529.3.p1 GENE.PLAT3529.3~~PLAT3529.3.p1  ORF type:complete len:1349 (-),score=673.98 PLAT3529.3:46-4092(-)
MEDYHLYEELGRGRRSVVYKGRRKSTLSFVAIKSVEKTEREMRKVFGEVQIMHKLLHRNVLAFKTWFETSRHLWLILEFCTGGDLLQLLKADRRLPESSVKVFGVDLLSGLLYLHSVGLLYCDLKPSNVLFDEYGVLKLCDFGLARPIPTEVEDARSRRRGTPCYMAPELFLDDGCHSFASDLWSLGCVLYELFFGRPPFTAATLPDLVSKLMHEEAELPPADAGVISPDFHHLLTRLLDKDPTTRMDWDDLCAHTFWDVLPAPELPELPAQPYFDAMAEKERRARARARAREREAATAGSPPPKAAAADRTLRESMRAVDVLRLSRIVRRNMQREQSTYGRSDSDVTSDGDSAGEAAEGKSDGSAAAHGAGGGGGGGRMEPDDIMAAATSAAAASAASAGGSGADSGVKASGGLALTNHDLEMDFQEPTEGGEGDEELASELGSDTPAAAAAATPHRGHRRTGSDSSVSSVDSSVAGAPVMPAGLLDEADAPSESKAAAAAAAEAEAAEAAAAEEAAEEAAVGEDVSAELASLDGQVRQLLFIPSDVSVKPIVGNTSIEPAERLHFRSTQLPVTAAAADELISWPQPKLEAFFTKLYNALSRPASSAQRLHVLGFFATLCPSAKLANMLVNSSLITLFMRLLRESSSALRLRLLVVIGLLFRHATFISGETCNGGLTAQLLELLRSSNSRIARAATATLGELLFYVSTQDDSSPDVWELPDDVLPGLLRCLFTSSNGVQKHYAAKAVENMLAQSSRFNDQLATAEVVAQMLKILRRSRTDSFRLTAMCALAHAVRARPALLEDIVATAGVAFFLRHPTDASSRMQQAHMNLINSVLALSRSRSLAASLLAAKDFPSGMVAILDGRTSVAVKGKALLAVTCAMRRRPAALAQLGEARLFAVLDRLHTRGRKDKFLTSALALAVDMALLSAARLLASASRVLAESAVGDELAPARVAVHLGGTLHLLNSALCRERAVSRRLLQHIGRCMDAIASGSCGADSWQSLAFMCCETIAQRRPLLRAHADTLVSFVLPRLGVLLTNESGELRTLAVKIMSDMLLPLVNSSGSAGSGGAAGDAGGEAAPAGLDDFIVKNLLLLGRALLSDDEPIPAYTLKLLAGIVASNAAFVSVLHRLNLTGLVLQQLGSSTHSVKLVQYMLEARIIPLADMYRLDIVALLERQLRRALSARTTALEPLLDVLYDLLYFASQAVSRSDDAMLPADDMLRLNQPLLPLLTPLLACLADGESQSRSERCSRCVLLMAQLYGSAAHELVLHVAGNLEAVATALAHASSASQQQRLLLLLRGAVIASSTYARRLSACSPLRAWLRRAATELDLDSRVIELAKELLRAR